MAEWVRASASTGARTVPGRVRIQLRKTSLRNFGNSVYPALPVSFGGDTKSRRSILSGVYARGSKISHQSALECVTVVDSNILKKSATMQRKTLPRTKYGRRRRRYDERVQEGEEGQKERGSTTLQNGRRLALTECVLASL